MHDRRTHPKKRKRTVTGEAVTSPVVSRRSGAVFEKRLVTKALAGATAGEPLRDPVSGDALEAEDLLDIVDSWFSLCLRAC